MSLSIPPPSSSLPGSSPSPLLQTKVAVSLPGKTIKIGFYKKIDLSNKNPEDDKTINVSVQIINTGEKKLEQGLLEKGFIKVRFKQYEDKDIVTEKIMFIAKDDLLNLGFDEKIIDEAGPKGLSGDVIEEHMQQARTMLLLKEFVKERIIPGLDLSDTKSTEALQELIPIFQRLSNMASREQIAQWLKIRSGESTKYAMERKLKIFKTLLEVDKTFAKFVKGKEVIVSKDKKGERYGFTILDTGQVMVEEEELGIGTYKNILGKILLGSSMPLAYAEVDKKYIDSTKKENQVAIKLHKIGVPHITYSYVVYHEKTGKSHASEGVSNEGFLQRRYDGTAEMVIQKDLKQILTVLSHVSECLAVLHKRGYVHRDIKPSNIMIKLDNEGNVAEGLVGDLGFVKKKGEWSRQGTSLYKPPEAFQNDKPIPIRSLPSFDNFSLGVTTYELITGKRVSFNGLKEKDLKKSIDNEKSRLTSEVEKEILAQKMILEETRLTEEEIEEKLFEFKIPLLKDLENKLAILDICTSLVHPDPRHRMTSKQASKAFSELLDSYPKKIPVFLHS
jgi:serine/threonine protein kinase